MSLRIQLSLLFLAGGLVLSDAAQASTCFTVSGEKVTVSGEKVTVNGLFKDGKPQVVELDMPSVSTVASRGSESHNLIFMNVKRDESKKNVTAFTAKVDGKDYAFPKDACPKK